MRRIWVILAAGIFCATLCALCYVWVDRPVEIFVAHHQRFRHGYQLLAAPSLLALPCALVFLAAYIIAIPQLWPPGRRAQIGLALSFATLIATAIKDETKWFFGRPWPDSWLAQGLYDFKPFTDDRLYGGFPSGHTAYIAAPLLLLGWLVPKYRPACLAIIALVMIGLVGAGYHYIGDTIAGLFVGLAAAAGTRALMPRGWG